MNSEGERYQFTGHEFDSETTYDYHGARYYNRELGRYMSVDPLQVKRLHLTPYNYVSGNPITRIDPDGKLDDEYDKNGKKISNLGGDKIDFYHQENGDTKIVDRESGASNVITDGARLIQGYMQRSNHTDWTSLFNEWDNGVGPEKSVFSDFNNTIAGVFGSFNSPFSVFASKGRSAVLNEGLNKNKVKFDYGDINPITAGTDGWQQFLGRANLSYYKLGDKVLFMVNDSKTMMSFAYRMWPFGNHERGDKFFGNKDANTYQTYLWTETMLEIELKNDTRNDAIQKLKTAKEEYQRTEYQRIPSIKW